MEFLVFMTAINWLSVFNYFIFSVVTGLWMTTAIDRSQRVLSISVRTWERRTFK